MKDIPDKMSAAEYNELLKKCTVNKKGRIVTNAILPEYKEKVIKPIFEKKEEIQKEYSVKELWINIPFVLPTFNEYIEAERTNRYVASSLKKKATQAVKFACRESINIINPEGKYDLFVYWTVPNNKTDSDNYYAGIKFILDGIVAAGVLKGDGRKFVNNIFHSIHTKKGEYKIDVLLRPIVYDNTRT